MAASDSAPDTSTVARLLDADADTLRQFVDTHPTPSVDVVVTAGVSGRDPDEIDAETRRVVADWIAREQRQWPGPRDEILSFLEDHGPATENDVTHALNDRSARIVRPSLDRLAREDTVHREDRDDAPALFYL